MKSNVAFSVVVPLYNKAAYVGEAIESVLNQSHSVLEIIVIDDGSTDTGPSIVRAIGDTRIKLLSQANAGVSAARNRGITAAQGEFVAFLDADDRYMPGYLEAMARLTRRYPDAAMYCAAHFITNHLRARRNLLHYRMGLDEMKLIGDFYYDWSKCCFAFTGSIVVRREALLSCNPMFPPGEAWGEDLDLWFRLAERFPVACVNSPLTEYRTGVANSATQSVPKLDLLPCFQRLGERLATGRVPASMRRGAKRLVASHLINIARARAKHGDIQGSVRLLSDARALGHASYWVRTALELAGQQIGLVRLA